MSIRIAICDDHQLVIDGLSSLLSGQDDIEIIATGNTGAEALRLAEHLKLDILLLDVDMPEMNGIEATRRIKASSSEVRVIILSMHDEKSIIQHLMDVGADGYILKHASQEELLTGIRNVAKGKKHFSSEVTLALLKDEPGNSGQLSAYDLTEREVEILTLIAEGLSNKEVGDKLFISHRTVDTHRTNLMKKLEVHNIAGLIRFAMKHGLIN